MPEDRPVPHITLNPLGVPCLDGTRHRVIDLIAESLITPHSAVAFMVTRHDSSSQCSRHMVS
jgi:hypothetical protein